ncbi:hypothetical protein JOB18_016298 [Solea senegalensis]|uniref:Uncharacterized protein n=1 Tax=Solea senegalensis TaxID=28829 RepID=A0AAV6S871_SOLSE|nr:hypothetical protein JOB18_016298 [Solea senegalensis]
MMASRQSDVEVIESVHEETQRAGQSDNGDDAKSASVGQRDGTDGKWCEDSSDMLRLLTAYETLRARVTKYTSV